VLPGVSDEFLAAVRGSHGVVVTATLCDPPGQTGVTPTGRALRIDANAAGTVTLDADADVRGTLDLTVAEPWPTALDATDLTPYGAEVFVTRGVEFGNGRIERAALGYYRLGLVEQGDARGTIRLTGQDRMGGIVDSRLLTPAQYGAGSTHGAVVELLVEDVYPGAVIEWDDNTATGRDKPLGRTVTEEEDRYKLLLDLVQSLGKICYFDHRGVLVVQTPPDPGQPVWQVDAGTNGVLVTLSRALSRDGVYNAVKATGEALDNTPPVVGYAFDVDLASPTRWGGPFGQVPRFYSSPLMTTVAQAEAAAASLLTQSRGLPYVVDFTAIPNPALLPLDPVEVVYPVDLTRMPHVARELHILAQLNIPLGIGGAMTANTRKQTIGGTA
jgi:hypothetical protein